jgi:tRNA splicing ligase
MGFVVKEIIMDQKIICLSVGLSQKEIEKGKALYFAASEGQSTLEVTAMSRSMLNMKIIEILACLMEELEKNPAEIQNDSADVIPADHVCQQCLSCCAGSRLVFR